MKGWFKILAMFFCGFALLSIADAISGHTKAQQAMVNCEMRL